MRTGFGTNNVDHCTRLCHASSVAALLEDVGSGAVSNQVEDVALADVAIVIGSNPTVNHPVAATFMKNAAKNGTKIILMDPRRSDLARHATYFLQFNGDTDVALLNGMLHVIIEEGLANEAFIRDRTENYEALRANVKDYSPEKVAPITGHRRADDPRGRAALRDGQSGDHLLGDGHLAAHPRHRQRALPDLARAGDRPDRPARARDCTRCAARTTCRARPTWG